MALVAVHQALALQASPRLAAAMREQPLPDDVVTVVRMAAGDGAVLADAEALGVRPERLREAAALYVQHVVLSPNADHYRILAAPRGATQAELRSNVAWLMKWLHPDRAQNEWESVFAQRVLAAWNALKSPERRAAYDRTLTGRALVSAAVGGPRRTLIRSPRVAPLIPRRRRKASWQRRARWIAVAVAGAAAVFAVFASWPGQQGPEANVPVASAEDGS